MMASCNILILGGTADARRLAEQLAGDPRIDATLSLAGRTAQPKAQPGRVRVGGFGGSEGLARYLRDERCIPEATIRAAIRLDLLREGPLGSMWAVHRDSKGAITGWEERGPEWRGFSTGGAKILFCFGPPQALRLCVTEAAIDALSLGALEIGRSDSLYLSTSGGWSPAVASAIRTLAARPGALLIAAMDNNSQGDKYADRLKGIASAAACGFERLRPNEIDWNAELKAGRREKET